MALMQRGAIMSWGKISISLAASALLTSIFASAAQAQQPDALPMLYRVKFVCGQPVGNTLAPGRYFTVINVHNPIEDASTKPVNFRMKFAVAPPQQGHTGFDSSFDVPS